MSLIASFLVVAAVGVVATAMADSSEPRPPRSEAQPTPLPLERAMAAGVDARLVAALRPFARPPRSQDELPARARARFGAMPSLGVNPDLARFVRTGPDGESYYLVAGTESVALVNHYGSGMIDDIDHALSGDSVGIEDCAGADRNGLRVIGILPPGAQDAAVRLTDGSTVNLDVVDSVYVAVFAKEAAALPVAVEWTRGGAKATAPVPVPADILQGRCRGA